MSRPRLMAVVAALLGAVACTQTPVEAPAPTAVEPGQGPQGVETALVISGRGLVAHAVTDFQDPSRSQIASDYAAWLGDVALLKVRLEGDHLLATAPATLAKGTYDLRVKDRLTGLEGTLAAAFTVTAPLTQPRLVMTGDGLPLKAGECSSVLHAPVEVTVAGLAAGETGSVAVTLGSGATGELTFYSKEGCNPATAISSLTVPRSGSAARVFLKATRAETVVLTATDATGALKPAELRLQVTPDDRNRLAFTSAAQRKVAGTCSDPVTVEIQDAYGNPAPWKNDTQVRLTGVQPPATTNVFKFYPVTDAGCDDAVALTTPTVKIGPNDTLTTFLFKSEQAGASLALVGKADALGDAQQAVTIDAAEPRQLVFTTPPGTVKAGACSGELKLEPRDAFGNPTDARADLPVVLSSSTSGVTIYLDKACATPAPASTLTLATGATSVSFSFASTTAAPALELRAVTAGLTPDATQTWVVNPEAPTKLVFTTPEVKKLKAGACSGTVQGTRVEVRDRYDNPSNVAAATAVALTQVGVGAFAFYADAACATAPVSSVTVPAQKNVVDLYFKGTVMGAPVVTASTAGQGSVSQTEEIVAEVASRLVFKPGAGQTAPGVGHTVVAGQPSPPVVVTTQDVYGNVSAVGADLGLALSVAPAAGFSFCADATCTAALSPAVVTVPANSSEVSFRFSGTVVSAPVVTATPQGSLTITQAVTQQQTITPATPERLVFSPATPQALVAGATSGALSLSVRDAFGNLSAISPSSATPITLTASPAAGYTSCTATPCTTPVTSVSLAAGSATAPNIYLRGTVAGSTVWTASATGVTSATLAATVSASTQSKLTVTSAPVTVAAGKCSSPVTVELQDTYGNAVAAGSAGLTLTLAGTGGLQFFTDAACGTAVTTTPLAAGATTATLYVRATQVGTPGLTISSGTLGKGTQTETIVADVPAKLVFTTGAQTRTAGACSGLATVQVQDAFGNPSPLSAPATLALSATQPALTFFAGTDTACATPLAPAEVPLPSLTADLRFVSTQAGTVTLTAASAGLTSATQGQTITAATASQVGILSAPTSQAAGACGALTVELRDAFGNPNTFASTVNFSLSGTAGVTFFSDSACGTTITSRSLSTGSTTRTVYFSSTTAGAVTLTVTPTTTGISGTASAGLTVTPAAVNRLRFTNPAVTIQAGGCGAVTVQSQDSFGNVTPASAGADTTLTLSATGSATFFSDSACTVAAPTVLLPAGQSVVGVYFSGTVAGSPVLTAAATGLANGTQTQTITAAQASQVVFSTAAVTKAAGVCSGAVTLQLKDQYGNVAQAGVGGVDAVLALSPVSGFSLFSDTACATALTGPVTIASGASTASFSYKGTVAGAATLSATPATLTAASQAATITPGSTTQLVFDLIAASVADGAAIPVTLRARDAYGNATPAFVSTATLTISPKGSVTPTTTAAFTAGVWSGTVTPSGAAGTGRTLKAVSGAASGTSNAFDVTVSVARSAPTALFTGPAWAVVGQSVTFDATSSYDYQTAGSALQVSWDTAASAGAPPWSAWSTTRTFSTSFSAAGTVQVRLAVQDADGDVGYAVRSVVVVDAASVCTVNSFADLTTHSGTTACGGTGTMSLADAIRLSNSLAGTQTIVIPAGQTVLDGTGVMGSAGALAITAPVNLVGGEGAALEQIELDVQSGTTTVGGLRFNNVTGGYALTAQVGATLNVADSVFDNSRGLEVLGTATVDRSQFLRCSSACLRLSDGSARATVRFSEFRDGQASSRGVRLTGACVTTGAALDVLSSSFIRMPFGILSECTAGGQVLIRHDTFHANGTALTFTTGTGHVVRNNVFTNQTTSAAVCGTATFTSRDYHHLFGNASSGCLAADANSLTSDPLYLYAAGDDLRLQQTSPAVNSALDLGLDVNGTAVGNFFGAGPDRGAFETW